MRTPEPLPNWDGVGRGVRLTGGPVVVTVLFQTHLGVVDTLPLLLTPLDRLLLGEWTPLRPHPRVSLRPSDLRSHPRDRE